MRKLITYSVLIMLFSMFSGSVFAGKYEECDEFKGEKRLYGLCNAYQNAYNHDDQDAMADIEANWEKWASLDDLPNGPGGDLVCPCWPNGETDYPVDFGWLPFDSQIAGDFAIALYEFGTVQYVVDLNFCAYINQNAGFEANVMLSTTDEEDAVCVQNMVDLIARDF